MLEENNTQDSNVESIATKFYGQDSQQQDASQEVKDNNTDNVNQNSQESQDTSKTTEESENTKNAEKSKENDDKETVSYDDITLPKDLPEGIEIDNSLLDKAKEIATKNNLSKDALQDMVNLYANKITEAQTQMSEQWQKIEQQWKQDTKNDQEIGGDKFDVKIEQAKRALKVFGTPDLNQALEQTRMGNHPELIRLLSRIGEKITEEGSFDTGNSTGQRSRADILFNNNNNN